MPMAPGFGQTTNPSRRANPSRPIRVRRRKTNLGRLKRVRPRRNQKRSGIVRPDVRLDAWSDQTFHERKFDRDDDGESVLLDRPLSSLRKTESPHPEER